MSSLNEQIKSIAEFIEDRKPSAVRKRIYFLLFGFIIGITLSAGVALYFLSQKEVEPPKATHIVYHCKQGKTWWRVPLVVEGELRTESQLYDLYFKLKARGKCSAIIIEPNWNVLIADEESPLRDGKGGAKR